MHIFHRWSKWRDVATGENGHVLQEKRCTICGKAVREWSWK